MQYIHRNEIFPLLLLILGLILLSFAGCASVPVMDAIKQTDTIINGDMLNKDHIITPTEKQQIKTVLIDDKAAIQQEQKTAIKAENKAKSYQRWAHIGYGAAAICGLLFVGFIAFVVIKCLRFFGV